MSEIAASYLSIMPSAKGFGSSMNRQIAPQMTSAGKTAGSRFGKVFAYASMSPLKAIGGAAVGLFAIQKVKAFFGSAISEARESQKVSALTASVIKSTGGAAGLSAKQIGLMANRLSLLTGVDDEQIQSGENLLLTFKNVKDYVAGQYTGTFSTATGIMLDMSAALGQDTKASAIQLGKALNDPVKGITALSRVGVSFTEAQKAQIKTLVDSGKTTQAQAIILNELKSEFGGAAAASATAGEKFHTAFANLEEAVGTALLPQLDRLLGVGTKVISFLIAKVPPAFAQVKAAVLPVAHTIGDFIQAHLQPFFTLLSGVGGAAIASFAALLGGTLVSVLGVLVGALASPVALIGALVGAAIYAYQHFQGFRDVVAQVVAAVQTNLVPVLQAAANTFQTVVLPAILALVGYVRSNFVPIFQSVAGVITSQVLPIVSSLAQFLYGRLYPAVIGIVVAVASKLKPVFDQLIATFRTSVLPTVQQLLAKFREWQPTLEKIVMAVVKVSGKILVFAAAVLAKVLPAAIRFQGFIISKLVPVLATVIGVLIKVIAKVIDFGGAVVEAVGKVAQFVKGVKEKFDEALHFIGSIPGKIKEGFSGALSILYEVGRDIIRGLINGIKAMAGEAAAAAVGVVKGAVDKAKSFLHIGSPSKLFHQIGQWTMEGFANGITHAGPKVLKAMDGVLKKTLDHFMSLRDGLRKQIDSIKSDMASLSDSIASSFGGDLFSAANAGEFMAQGFMTKGTLQALKKAFKTLRGWGLSPKFLSELFASGNTDLIFSLASGSKSQGKQAAKLFGLDTRLSHQLGNQVAQNQYGAQLHSLDDKLGRIEKHVSKLQHLAKDLGHEINAASASGHRKGKHA